jgi:signal transduction histidine kinase
MGTDARFVRPPMDARLGERLLLLLGSLGYRAMATPVSLLPVLFYVDPVWSIPAVMVGLALAGGNAWAMTRLGSWLAMPLSRFRMLLGVDTVVVVAANLLLGVVLSRAGAGALDFVLWPLVQGSILLIAALVGMRTAFGAVLAGIPLAVVMCTAYGVEPRAVPAVVVSNVMWLSVSWSAIYLARYVIRSQGQVAQQRGVHEGREVERARGMRLMHDTALQSLEAIALLASNPALDDRAGRQLVERAARGEIRTVRKILAGLGADGLRAEVSEVVDAARDRGLPVDLTASGDGDLPVDPLAAEALCGALREALSNAHRHASANRVAVRVDVTGTLLSAEIEDDGVGFDPATVSLGFGIPESIEARVRAVGGSARVRSAVGQGTTVSVDIPRAASSDLSVPAADDTTSGGPDGPAVSTASRR